MLNYMLLTEQGDCKFVKADIPDWQIPFEPQQVDEEEDNEENEDQQ